MPHTPPGTDHSLPARRYRAPVFSPHPRRYRGWACHPSTPWGHPCLRATVTCGFLPGLVRSSGEGGHPLEYGQGGLRMVTGVPSSSRRPPGGLRPGGAAEPPAAKPAGTAGGRACRSTPTGTGHRSSEQTLTGTRHRAPENPHRYPCLLATVTGGFLSKNGQARTGAARRYWFHDRGQHRA